MTLYTLTKFGMLIIQMLKVTAFYKIVSLHWLLKFVPFGRKKINTKVSLYWTCLTSGPNFIELFISTQGSHVRLVSCFILPSRKLVSTCFCLSDFMKLSTAPNFIERLKQNEQDTSHKLCMWHGSLVGNHTLVMHNFVVLSYYCA